MARKTHRNPWAWIPSLYFAEGLPYVVVMTVSVIMYKKLDISNTEIALYTSWLYLPWVIKPLWSPIVDTIRTRRLWIVVMQLLVGAGLAGVALTIPGPKFLTYTLAFFWLLAFSSATHDVAADGFYMLGLSTHDQAWFVGFRSTFYRLAMITGQGLLVILAGYLEESTGSIPAAWATTFYVIAGFFVVACLYHALVLPYPSTDVPSVGHDGASAWEAFVETFASFFRKTHIWSAVAFFLFYRFAEAQLVKLASPFLLDTAEAGGLAMSTSEVGFAYGTVGIVALTIGGLLGGFVAARHGLKFWLWPMVVAINVPNLVYIFLAVARPEDLIIINSCIAVEQFGYGFGFTAFMLYMIYVAEGSHKTAHFALCTGFMALGMMIPGMFSGWVQELLGYVGFFGWVLIATIPSFLVSALIRIDPDFGKKIDEDQPGSSETA